MGKEFILYNGEMEEGENFYEPEPIDVPTYYNWDDGYAIMFDDNGDHLYKIIPIPTTQSELDSLIDKYEDVCILYDDSTDKMLENIEQLEPWSTVGIYCGELTPKVVRRTTFEELRKNRSPKDQQFFYRTAGIEWTNLNYLLNQIKL